MAGSERVVAVIMVGGPTKGQSSVELLDLRPLGSPARLTDGLALVSVCLVQGPGSGRCR